MRKAAEILAQILDEKSRRLGQTYDSVFGAWSQVVGDSLSEHSRIYEFTGRNVFIEVDHPGWMQLLLFKKPQILRSLKRKYPALDIRDLRIKVNLNYANTISEDLTVEAGQRSDEGETDKAQQEELDRVLSEVPHEELKRRLKRLFLKSIEKEGSG
ncbi:MAG: DUF721 domain-containing protein [Spirochaetaceae bacterium]|nr:MAG: DUF721 domain-containing protein [Spirochaetaceae bacterium]